MAVMIVAHPIPGFSGHVRVEDVGLSFVGGFTGPTEVPSGIQAQLTAAGYTLNATPAQDYGDKYLTAADWQNPNSAFSAAQRAAFGRAPEPTGVAATDTANLTAMANSMADSGGVILLAEGTYRLNAPLPVLPGVHWVGVQPTTRQVATAHPTWLADGAFVFESGTVLKGDGTFAAFTANLTANLDATQPGLDEIPQAGWTGIGFEDFTYGIHVGARGVMGLSYATLDKLHFRNCSQWAVRLVNFAHIDVGVLYAAGCKRGFYFGSSIRAFTPGNSRFGELYVYMPTTDRFARGIQFHTESWGGSNGSLAHLEVQRLQVNRFQVPETVQTGTLTSGSANIGVTDGTQFEPGMLVKFSTTGNGFTAGQLYVVKTVVGNTLTVAHNSYDAAVSATGSGSVELRCRGHASLAFTVSDAPSYHVAYNLLNIDIEGPVGAAIYAERGTALWLGSAVAHTTSWQDVVLRSTNAHIQSRARIKTDVDANSAASLLFGQRGALTQRPLRGIYEDLDRGTWALALGGGAPGVAGGDIETRAGFLYPNRPVGEAIFPRNAALTIAGSQSGDVVCAAASPFTITLPTIVSDATPGTSHVGMWFDVVNVGTATVTVATDGTQLFNKVAAKTSLAIGAQQSMKVIAAKDAAGTLFWVAKATQALS